MIAIIAIVTAIVRYNRWLAYERRTAENVDKQRVKQAEGVVSIPAAERNSKAPGGNHQARLRIDHVRLSVTVANLLGARPAILLRLSQDPSPYL